MRLKEPYFEAGGDLADDMIQALVVNHAAARVSPRFSSPIQDILLMIQL